MNINLLAKVLSHKTLGNFLSFFLTISLLFGMLTGITVSAQVDTTTSKVSTIDATAETTATPAAIYVALGDSVPAGYALSDTKKSYVQLFSDELTKSGYGNTLYNYAVSGDTTNDLISILQNMQVADPEALKNLQNANVITLNIGGNNVLGPLIKTINESLKKEMDALGITSIAQANSTQLWTIAASLYTLKLDATQIQQIQQGAQNFKTDFPKIIEWLNTNAPGADIIVSTIYNAVPSYLSFYSTSTSLLQEMNSVITTNAGKSGYYVADIYTAFAKEQSKGTQIVNLNLGQYTTSPISVDIHPNSAGHALIAKVHGNVFQTIPSIVTTTANTPITSIISLSGKVNKSKTLSLEITEKSLRYLIEKAQKEAKQLDLEDNGISVIYENKDTDIKNLNITFDAAAINLLKSESVMNVTIQTNIARFSLNSTAIQKIQQKSTGNVLVKINAVTKLPTLAKKLIGNRPTFKLTLKDTNGNTLSDLGKGKLTLGIPYTSTSKENNSLLHMVAINSNGTATLITSSSYLDGWVSSTSSTISTFGIGYKK